jgi:hypothetical protein
MSSHSILPSWRRIGNLQPKNALLGPVPTPLK